MMLIDYLLCYLLRKSLALMLQDVLISYLKRANLPGHTLFNFCIHLAYLKNILFFYRKTNCICSQSLAVSPFSL